jgi:hypothetical protein
MNGPQHYQEAERYAEEATDPAGHGVQSIQQHIALAQVHATLALAAATAELDASEGPGGGSATGRTAERGYAWEEVLG